MGHYWVVVVFSVVNWNAITAPTEISLVFTTVQAPLGLILLALLAFIVVFFLGFFRYLQTSVLLESRRNSRELSTQRELADKAEASRFTDLRTFVEAELKSLNTHVDEVEKNVKDALEQSANSLSAYIGESEDRLERSSHFSSTSDSP